MMSKDIVDLLISHGQIRLENRNFDESYCQWGDGNLKQGCIIHDGFVVFDPIIDDSFGANVEFKILNGEDFDVDPLSQRCIAVPFQFDSRMELKISSAFEQYKLSIDLENGLYQLYFEIIEGKEVYYRFTIDNKINQKPVCKYIINDDFGGCAGRIVEFGYL
ncbi:hypothetical protein VroAM7_48670 [Vibrio rotiferianus]|uniref:Competence protein n=1 Tax=Vibrio rotiferianus TaxID=190895 RepID=A0A510IEI8_9VIBR|nr:competence protein ComJ [Vibrio rotiferianus]BBL92214.1 hypothetical protein VroAM7_48670 [Vibrio rotiferianus]